MLSPNILFSFAVHVARTVKNQYVRSVRGVHTCNLIYNKKMPVSAAHQKFLAMSTNALTDWFLVPARALARVHNVLRWENP
jgi:hypothetical protein